MHLSHHTQFFHPSQRTARCARRRGYGGIPLRNSPNSSPEAPITEFRAPTPSFTDHKSAPSLHLLPPSLYANPHNRNHGRRDYLRGQASTCGRRRAPGSRVTTRALNSSCALLGLKEFVANRRGRRRAEHHRELLHIYRHCE
jgi:hypothetical protein